MTSKVVVTACCASTKEVHVEVTGEVSTVLQNGEEASFYIYDDRIVSAREVERKVHNGD